MRSVISIGVLNHPRDICVHIDVFSEGGGDTVGGLLRAGKGFFLGPLDRYTAITRRRIDPTSRRLEVRRIPR